MHVPDQDTHSSIRLAIVAETLRDISPYATAVERLREVGEPIVMTAITLDSGSAPSQTVNGTAGPRPYDSLIDLLVAEDLDGVVVASSLDRRAGHVMDALEYSRHVLVETPPAASLESAVEMRRVAEELELLLVPANALRFAPAVRAAAPAVAGGEIGKPRLFLAAMSDMWDGVPTELLGQALDLARWLMGDIARIRAIAGDGSMLVELHFASGALGSLGLTVSRGPVGTIHIAGDGGHISADIEPGGGSGDDGGSLDQRAEMVGNFVRTIHGSERPFTSAWDGYALAELVAAVRLALDGGTAIDLPLEVARDPGPP